MIAQFALSIGAINALIPVIVILILIAAAAGLTRGAEIFKLFGVSTLLGIKIGRGTLTGKSPFKAKARVAGGGGAGALGKLAVQGAKAGAAKLSNKQMVAAGYAQGGRAIINNLKAGGAGVFAYSSPVILKNIATGPNSSPNGGMVQMSTSKTLRNNIRLPNPNANAKLGEKILSTVGQVDKKSTAAFKSILDQKLPPKAEKKALDLALKQHVQEMAAAHKSLIQEAKAISKESQPKATLSLLLKNSDESLRDKITLSKHYHLELARQQTLQTLEQLKADKAAKDALKAKAQSLGGVSKLNLDDQDMLKSFGKLNTSSYQKRLDGITAKLTGIQEKNKELYDKYHAQVEEAAKQQLVNKKLFEELEKITNAKKFHELHKG
ncbi:MAG: hypothetical protein KGH71_05870 [Candidatus Micrarchaeota archaeon]|nr:hypothetical protein [Candidatus Micrarchaeota archaeon]